MLIIRVLPTCNFLDSTVGIEPALTITAFGVTRPITDEDESSSCLLVSFLKPLVISKYLFKHVTIHKFLSLG